jgi:MFS family permease
MLDIFALGIYNYPNFAMAALLALCLGSIIAPIMIASNTIIHSVSDNDMLGKIFSSFEIVMHLGFLLFMFISSMLAERFSHLLILVIVGALLSLLGLVNLFFNRKAAWLN